MNKNFEIVQRIESHYVDKDCVQVMAAYQNSMTMLSKDTIMYHYLKNSHIHINKYLEDERRNNFPYNNIPVHFARHGLKKYTYTNQLLNFEEPYFRIGDGIIIESYVIKDGNEALLSNRIMNKEFIHSNYENVVENITRQELENMFIPKENEKIYMLGLDGSIYLPKEDLLLPENKIIEKTQKLYSDQLIYFNKALEKGDVLCISQNVVKYFQKSIDEMATNNIAINTRFVDNILFIKTNENSFDIRFIDSISLIKPNYYEVSSINIPVTKYTLEQLKFLNSKIKQSKEPKISLRLNNGITKQLVNESKQMVKILKKIK